MDARELIDTYLGGQERVRRYLRGVEAGSEVDDEAIRNAVKAGKRIERLDLFVRFRKPQPELVREANRLLHRIGTTSLKYNRSALMHVAAMVEEDPVNYEELLPMIWKIV